MKNDYLITFIKSGNSIIVTGKTFKDAVKGIKTLTKVKYWVKMLKRKK